MIKKSAILSATLLMAVVATLAGCASSEQSCIRLGIFDTESDLRKLHAAAGENILVAGHNAFQCGCVAGHDALGNSSEAARRLAATSKTDSTGKPDKEARRWPVACGAKIKYPLLFKFSSSMKSRDIRGAVRIRKIFGAVEATDSNESSGSWIVGTATCRVVGDRVVYRLYGMPAVRFKIFDGGEDKKSMPAADAEYGY